MGVQRVASTCQRVANNAQASQRVANGCRRVAQRVAKVQKNGRANAKAPKCKMPKCKKSAKSGSKCQSAKRMPNIRENGQKLMKTGQNAKNGVKNANGCRQGCQRLPLF